MPNYIRCGYTVNGYSPGAQRRARLPLLLGGGPAGPRSPERNVDMAAVDELKPAPKENRQSSDSDAVRSAAIVIIVVMSITALKVGRPVVLPVIVAVLLSLLLSTPVRWLRHKRI